MVAALQMDPKPLTMHYEKSPVSRVPWYFNLPRDVPHVTGESSRAQPGADSSGQDLLMLRMRSSLVRLTRHKYIVSSLPKLVKPAKGPALLLDSRFVKASSA